MKKGYKKIEQGIVNIAKDLLGREVGKNVDTIASYSERFDLSLGTIQKAFLSLETEGVIGIKRKGKSGSELEKIDINKLLKIIDLRFLLCVMPVTYSARYKKLMESINENLLIPLPLYFSHMRGGDVRLNLVAEGVYSCGITSRLAADIGIKSGMNLEIIAKFGPKSYLTKHVILKRENGVKKIGRDYQSNDHFFLTNLNFSKDINLEIIDIKYSDIIENLLDGTIDAAIWNYDDIVDRIDYLQKNGIIVEELKEDAINSLATEAVIVVKGDNSVMKNIFTHFFEKDKLKY